MISRAGNFSSYGRLAPVFVRPDLWQSYLKVIREKCSDAPHILDRFHAGGTWEEGREKASAAICRKVAETLDGGSIDTRLKAACCGSRLPNSG